MPQAPASTGSLHSAASSGDRGVSSRSKGNNGPSMMMPLRSESLAYPKTPASHRAQFFARQHGQKILYTAAFVVFILFISSDYVHDSNGLGSHGFLRRNAGYVL